MKNTRLYKALLILCGALLLVANADAARVELRRAKGDSQFSAELGQTVDMEVFIDSEGEELTGFSLYLSYDTSVFCAGPGSRGGRRSSGAF